jgi:hypothetical protein
MALCLGYVHVGALINKHNDTSKAGSSKKESLSGIYDEATTNKTLKSMTVHLEKFINILFSAHNQQFR